MKWSDLTLKERKQIYDAVRAKNPNASYFDIKSQFDLIPEYEDGVSSTNLNGQWGKPISSGMSHWEKANRDFKKLLSGLNKTIGTALTGASLATAGIWNAARLLSIGKGSTWRLAAAKNALIGSKAGLAADIGNFIEEPTVTNGVQVALPKVGSKDLTTTSNKIVNTISTGFDFDDLTKVPTYEDGGIHIKKKNKGKFNALKKRTGKSTEELTHSKNPLTRKRAIFAQNAAKWNKSKKKK